LGNFLYLTGLKSVENYKKYQLLKLQTCFFGIPRLLELVSQKSSYEAEIWTKYSVWAGKKKIVPLFQKSENFQNGGHFYPKMAKNAVFGPLGLKFSQNVRNRKVNWRCNNFGRKKDQPHPKTSQNTPKRSETPK
jgi:hypothetical protein